MAPPRHAFASQLMTPRLWVGMGAGGPGAA